MAASPCNDAGGVKAGEGGGVGSTSASGVDHTSAMTALAFLKGIGMGADPDESTDLLIVSMAVEPALPPPGIPSPGPSTRRAPQAPGARQRGGIERKECKRRGTQKEGHQDSAALGSGPAYARRNGMRQAESNAQSSGRGWCVRGEQQRLQRVLVLRERWGRVIM